jgi:hypothetical protein
MYLNFGRDCSSSDSVCVTFWLHHLTGNRNIRGNTGLHAAVLNLLSPSITLLLFAEFWIDSGTSGFVVPKSIFLEQLTVCVERRNEVPFATPKHAVHRNLRSRLHHVPRICRWSETEEKAAPSGSWETTSALLPWSIFHFPDYDVVARQLVPDFAEEELFV